MSGFKTILPAHGSRVDKIASKPSRSSSTSSILPEISKSRESRKEPKEDLVGDEERPKRRRQVKGKVAVIACSECRRTRSKCDGEVPKACGRCKIRGYRCEYQPHTKIQKDDLISGLEQEKALTACLSQRNHDLSLILEVISHEAHLHEIVQKLKKKEEAKSIADWLSSLPEIQRSLRRKYVAPNDIEDVILDLAKNHNIDVSPAVRCSGEEHGSAGLKWTRVTANVTFLDYLVQLYLDCVHINCMLFNELAFVQTYKTGGGNACSKPLLNAICAMACNILDRRYIGTEEDASDIASLHQCFLAEARASISLVDSQDLTTIQAMAVIYLADLSSGKARSANTYLNCAAESLRSLKVEQDLSPDLDLTCCGINSLEAIFWAFRNQSSRRPPAAIDRIVFDKDMKFLETFSDDAEMGQDRVAIARSKSGVEVAAHQARISRLAHEVMESYNGCNGQVTPDIIFSNFIRYLELFTSMPEMLRQPTREQAGMDIRCLHIVFYSMVSSLWLPVLFFAKAKRNKEIYDDCCDYVLESSRQGVNLVEGMLQNKSCQTLPPQHLFCVLNVCDSVARWSPDRIEQLDTIHTCFQLLERNTMNFKLCGLLKKLFLTEIEKFLESEVVDGLKKQYEIYETCTVEEALDATNRLTYIAPFPSMTNWLHKDFQVQWSDAWDAMIASQSTVRRQRYSSASISSNTGITTSSTTNTGGIHVMSLDMICN